MMDGTLRGYALCGEARAGTTFLKELLASTGKLGEPSEWFSSLSRSRVAPAEDIVTVMLARTATANGVYGLKIFSAQVKAARRSSWVTRLPNLSFVHIRRHDLLGQAISLARAVQTDRYVHDRPEVRPPQYNRRAITSALITIARGQARWELWFARHGISPLRLTYENLIDEPTATVDRVAAFVGVEDVTIDWNKVKNRTMRDEQNDDWRERYISASGSRDVLPGLTDWSARAMLGKVRQILP